MVFDEFLAKERAYERSLVDVVAEQRERYGRIPAVCGVGEDLQFVADRRRIDFSYGPVADAFRYQYRRFYRGPLREREFVECRANLLLETLIAHYGPGNGGGRKGNGGR